MARRCFGEELGAAAPYRGGGGIKEEVGHYGGGAAHRCPRLHEEEAVKALGSMARRARQSTTSRYWSTVMWCSVRTTLEVEQHMVLTSLVGM
jgi:hypothetical protein